MKNKKMTKEERLAHEAEKLQRFGAPSSVHRIDHFIHDAFECVTLELAEEVVQELKADYTNKYPATYKYLETAFLTYWEMHK